MWQRLSSVYRRLQSLGMQAISLDAGIGGSRLARDRGCWAGGQKLPSEIVATVEQFGLRYEVVHCHAKAQSHWTAFHVFCFECFLTVSQ